MAKWKIEKNTSAYEDKERFEEIDAEKYADSKDGKWIEFYNLRSSPGMGGGRREQVLRVRSEDVLRIERLDG